MRRIDPALIDQREDRSMRRKTHAKYAYEDEETDLKEMPISVVRDLEEHQFASAERVHGLARNLAGVYY